MVRKVGRGHGRSAAARHQRKAGQIELAQNTRLPPGPRGRIDGHLDHHLPPNLHLLPVDRVASNVLRSSCTTSVRSISS